jgi:hypothetical protein
MAQEWLGRRFTALVAVLALHSLFLLMLLAREPITRIVTTDARSSLLFLMEAPQPTAPTAPPAQSRATRRTAPVVHETSTPEQTTVEPVPAVPSAPIDWNAQATEAAAAVVDKAIRQETRKCDPSDSPSSFLPRCEPRSYEFKWNPDPKVGFSGGLPYVRVGERCVIGLPFFACGIGRLPPANGDLFEGMSDAERDRSSVPSPNPPEIRE